MTAQRFFCCRSPREARKAVLWSSVAMLIPLMMLTVGIGLYAYYQAVPMTAGEAAKGYVSAAFSASGTNFPVIQDIKTKVYGAGKGNLEDPSRLTGSADVGRRCAAGCVAGRGRQGGLRVECG